MTKNVVTAEASQPVKDVLQVMADKGIGCVVITEKNSPAGIVTERDIVRRILREQEILRYRAGEIMTKPLISVTPDTPVIDALHLMKEKDIRRLPVVQDSRLEGILTIHSDLLYWAVKEGKAAND
jgi:CBS domain-containing protein